MALFNFDNFVLATRIVAKERVKIRETHLPHAAPPSEEQFDETLERRLGHVERVGHGHPEGRQNELLERGRDDVRGAGATR